MISEYEQGCPCGDGKVPDQEGKELEEITIDGACTEHDCH